MTRDRLDRWARMRRIGPLSYIAIYGVVLWGGLTALIFALLMALLSPAEAGFAASFMIEASRAFVIFPIGGVLWGASMWWLSERAYARASGARAGGE